MFVMLVMFDFFSFLEWTGKEKKPLFVFNQGL